MSQREYAEDTVFWALKDAVQFSARRRTTHLFLASPKNGAKNAYSWIDNTAGVWEDLRNLFAEQQVSILMSDVYQTISCSVRREFLLPELMHAPESRSLRPR